MSDETLIKSYNDRINALTAESMKRKEVIRSLRKQLAETEPYRQALLDLEAERDELAGKLKDNPSEVQAKLDQALASIRERDHRDAFAAAIGPELADKVAVADLWTKAGYTPGESIPTADQIRELAGKARDAAPYLFKPAGETPADKAPAGASKPPLHTELPAGRGKPDQDGSRFTVRRSDLDDASWMQRNQDKLSKAYADGSVSLID